MSAITDRTQRTGDSARLTALQSAGRSVAALNGSAFPSDIAARIPVGGIDVATGASDDAGEVSVSRLSTTRVAYVVVDGEGCRGLVDDLTANSTTWVWDTETDAGNCDASRIGLTQLSGGVSIMSPAAFDFDLTLAAPDAPAAPNVDVAGTTANVSFTAPANDGGAPVSEYTVTCSSSTGGTLRDAAGAASPLSVGPLTAGATYTCTVKAANSRGYGPDSPASAPFSPYEVANAPSGLVAAPADAQVALSWTPLTSTAEMPVSGYRVYRDGQLGCQVTGAAANTCTVTGLSNGQLYSFQVAAYYYATEGTLSSAVLARPRTVPSAPSDVDVTVSMDAVPTANVSFAQPADDGGSLITQYRATCSSSNGGTTATATGSDSPVAVTGVTAGKTYTCTVAARNDAGWSAESAASAPFSSAAPPAAPSNVTGSGQGTAIVVSFNPPGYNGGAPVTDYRVTCESSDGGTTQTGEAVSSPITVSALTPGKTYTCTAAARNAAGWSVESAPTASFTAYNLPATPTGIVASPADGEVAVSWITLADSPANPVGGYRVFVNGSFGCQVSGAAATTCTVTGLQNGTSYSFQVAAFYASSESPYSPVVYATPRTVADAPTDVAATAEASLASVAFSAPAWNGGAEITLYRATCDSSNGGTTRTETASSSPIAVGGLTAGKTYTCTVAAENAAGWSAESTPSSPFVAYTVPDAPSLTSVSAPGTAATVVFSTPGFDGGSPITSYRATCLSSNGGTARIQTGAASPLTVANLTAGKTYLCTVAAENLAGWSDESNPSNTFVAYTTPDAPTSIAVVVTGTNASVTYAAPAFDGGNLITGYRASCVSSDGGTTRSGTAASGAIAVTGLTATKTYTCTVAAQNSAGWGADSAPSASFVPFTVPGAPTGVSATVTTTSASVAFTAPASNGGRPVSAYRATCSSSNGGTTVTVTGAASPLTVTGLTATKSYSCTVAAQNIAGWSVESTASASFTAYTTADAPTDVEATPGFTTSVSLDVAFTVPASNGGRPVTAYRATCESSDGGTTGTATAASSPVTVDGLSKAKTYTCTVAAENLAGWSAESSPSAAVVTFIEPDAPTATAASLVSAAPTSVTATFTAPGFDGGSPITTYRVRCTSSSGTLTETGASSPLTVTGLTPGETYTCTAAARNVVGYGNESDPTASFVPYNIPGTPTGLAATPDDRRVDLSWDALTSTTASPVAGYRVYLAGGTLGCTAVGAATTTCAVTGLTNGTSYSFQVVAYYAATEGVLSAAVTATPRTTPDAPTGLTGTPADGEVALTWTAPGNDGGAAVTGYQYRYSSDNGATWGAVVSTGSTATARTVTGLTNGTWYVFQVRAVNAAGGGTWAESSQVRPRTVPSAPTGLAATAGNGSLALTWTAPASTGGAPLSEYTYELSTDGGTTWDAPVGTGSTSTSRTVTGLTNGTAYTVRVKAVNEAGSSPASSSAGPVTPVAPAGAPTNFQGTPGNSQVTLTWTASANTAAAPVTGYRVTESGATVCTVNSATTATCSVTGLTNGTSYSFSLYATGPGGNSSTVGPVAVIPYTVPSAPSVAAVTIVAPGAQGVVTPLDVSYTVPSSNGGNAITSYRATCSTGGSPTSATGSTSPIRISGLTANSVYTCTVAAQNAAGWSSESAASGGVRAYRTPDAPTVGAATIVTATPTSADVAYTAPAFTGGNTISSYRATCTSSNGGTTRTQTGASSPLRVTGLTATKTYTCTVAAQNTAGWGPESSATNSVIAYRTPDAPATPTVAHVAPTVTGAVSTLTVTFTAPADGGNAITAYRATCSSSDGGTTRTATGASSPLTVTGLTAASTYTCTVAAQNAAGWSSESATSAAVIPYRTADTPSAPTTALETPSTQGTVSPVTVAFTAPASDGGRAVTSYRATCTSSNGGTTRTQTGAASPLTVSGLTTDKSYTCTVAAENAAGWTDESAASTPALVTYRTPDAPTVVTAAVQAGTPTTMQVTFAAPSTDGGRPVLEYRASCSSADGGAAASATGEASPLAVAGLTAGKSYTCTVAARNLAGWGVESAATSAVTAYNTPGTVSGLLADPGNATVALTWTPLASTAADPIGGYRVFFTSGGTTTLGCLAVGASSAGCTVSGLANGTAYAFQILAYYQDSEGPLSAAVTATPRTVPDAPTAASVSVVLVGGTANTAAISFSAPAWDGGSAITGYEAVCSSSDGGSTRLGSGSQSPVNVTTLDVSNTYTCTVAAQNAAGIGAASDPSATFTTYRTPDAPAAPTATANPDASAGVSFSAPAFDGGRAVSSYRASCVSSNGGVTRTQTGSASPLTVTALTPGKSYACTVAAQNQAGWSSESASSASVVPYNEPASPGTPAVTLSAPPSQGATSTASVAFTAPADDGGRAVTLYRVTCSSADGGVTATATGAASPVTVAGLTAATTYTCTAAAQNLAGWSAESAASASFTPYRTPDAPTGAAAQLATGAWTSTSVSFAAPADDGGRAVTLYRVTCSSADGGTPASASGASSPVIVENLTPATTYTCTVAAQNAAGFGPESSPSGAVDPYTVPATPSAPSVAVSLDTASVTIATPFANGRPVTELRATCTSSNGGTTVSTDAASSPVIVSGLTPGKTYTCTAAAQNLAGWSATSSPSPAFVPFDAADAPAGVSLTPGNTQIAVSWTPLASTELQPVAGYRAFYDVGGTATLGCTAVGATASGCTITGLANGTTYSVQVAAYYDTVEGALSAALTATPYTTPDAPVAPTATLVVGSSTDATVAFSAPSANGAPITSYTVACSSSDGGTTRTASVASSPATVLSLTPAKTYTCTVTAQNAAGTSAASPASNTVSPFTTPDEPTAVTATAATDGTAAVTVGFTAPGFDGGSAIVEYDTYCVSSNGGTTGTALGAGSPIEVTGLTAGKTYTCTVAARNAAGPGPDSLPSAPVVPFVVPDAPTGAAGVVEPTTPTTATVTFSSPAFDGGSAITSYRASCASSDGGTARTQTGAASPLTVVSLTPGKTYTCTVAAQNTAGWSVESAASATFVPYSPAPAVAGLSAAPSDATLTVSWSPLTSTAAEPVSGYTATAAPGGASCSVASAATGSCAITGLTNGTTYTVTVRALHNGTYGASASTSGTPYTIPGAPQNVTGSVTEFAASVTFSAPADGGNAITSYRATCSSSDGGTTRTQTGASSPISVTGLTPASTYTCTVAAQNAAGWSPESSATAPAATLGYPDAPTDAGAVLTTSSRTEAIVTFSPPATAAATSVTAYRATCSSSDGGVTVSASDASGPVGVAGLTAGKTYTCTVAAQNAAGFGPESSPTGSFVPYNIPGTPSGLAATPANTQVTLSWDAMSSTAADPIAGYRVYVGGALGCLAAGEATTTCTVTGLQNGTAYSFQVAAYYLDVEGVLSAAVSATPRTTPGTPTGVTATPGVASGSVAFSAPGSDGGSAVTTYETLCSWNGGSTTQTGSSSPHALSGLPAGETISCTVRAQNAAGWSSPSSPATFSTIVAPGAPTGVTVTISPTAPTSVSVAFSAPTSDGGDAISFYDAGCTSTDGGTFVSMTGASSPVAVTGLTADKTYSCDVTAFNIAGNGPTSDPSSSFVPYTTPGAPTAVSASIVVGSPANASVSFSPPVSTGGRPVTSYTATCASSNGGTTRTSTGAASPLTVANLTGATTYTCTVTAENLAGSGPASDASGAVYPSGPPGAPTSPAASLVATPVPTSASVSFTAPASNGGSAITGYTATCSSSDGGTTRTATGASSPLLVEDLTPAKTYTCTVVATNANGSGDPSSATSAISPYTTPDAPTALAVAVPAATPTSVTVSFTAPAFNGGSAITRFVVGCSSTGLGAYRYGDGTSSPITITGLTAGQPYTCMVAAENAAGIGTWSSESASFSAYNVPGTPSGFAATPGNTSITLSWTAMSSTAASPVAGYRAYYSNGTLACQAASAATNNCLITGLANGTSYSFQLAAYYSSSEGVLTAAVSATPRTVPGAPTITGWTPTTSNVTLSFSAPASNGGSAITGYTAACTSTNGGATQSATGAGSPLTVTLSNTGVNYSCSVTAQNAAGSSAASGAKTLTNVQGSSTSYSCPSGGSLSGTTCTQTVVTWIYTYYYASCYVGGYTYNNTNNTVGYRDYRTASNFTNYFGQNFVNNWADTAWVNTGPCGFLAYERYWASNSCFENTSGGGIAGTCGTRSSSGRPIRYYRRVAQDWRYVFNYCPSGGAVSGDYCYPNYPDSGYNQTTYPTYTATATTTYYWNGWSVT
jgi:titin